MFRLDVLPSTGALQLLVGGLLLLFGLNSYSKYRRALEAINYRPGFRVVVSLSGFLGNALPRIPGVSIGANWSSITKHKWYADAGVNVLSYVTYPSVTTTYLLADPVAVKEVTLHRARFPKPVQQYTVLAFFGKNIVVTENEEWKRHRKVTAPAFTERNNKLVWDEAVRATVGMFDSWGTDKSEVVIDHGATITLQLALLVIGAAGFGQRLSWGEDKEIPPGHRMTFRAALHTVSSHILVQIVVPKWAYYFSKTFRHYQDSVDELQAYMQEMVAERKASEGIEDRHDLFSALLDANAKDDMKNRLSDQEVIGNIFIFLIAGHETSANTLCFALGLLAIEQEEQEILYQQIISLVPTNDNPTYEQMSALTYPLAVLYETLRLFPSVPVIPKYSVEDTTLPTLRPDGSMDSIVVPKGTVLILNPPGLHYNPRIWPDPMTFKPSRFLGDWPKDAFLPFSGGARACLGRRFSEIESVAILTLIVRRYRIELKNPEQYEGLTPLQKRDKLLRCRQVITMTPLNVPLVFKKRSCPVKIDSG
ncbi:cytochrome P450 [Gautieria morchelliformis]|nr:cytochrome P450 [Gautieria morchelliformis]